VKQALAELVKQAVQDLQKQGILAQDCLFQVKIDGCKSREHGDFASNIALTLARSTDLAPRQLAARIVAALPVADCLQKTEIAGPGFINFFLRTGAQNAVIEHILDAGEHYGHNDHGHNQSVMVEFVSANPTGPLHVGHGRGAAYGDTLARILKASGYRVATEYYVNDAGRQMAILALSVWLRYLELCGEEGSTFPAQAYQGDYVFDIAASLHRQDGERWRQPLSNLYQDLPGHPDKILDLLILRMRKTLAEDGYERVFKLGLDTIVADIRGDLEQFGVHFDCWFSERSLVDSGAIDRAIEVLKANNHLYQQEGAWWFRSTAFGDEKDRVVIRENGAHTYFAADIAYHLNKVERGFSVLFDIWGADHHGYIPRVKASFAALGKDPQALHLLLVQFAVLYRGQQKVSMSTRSGDFVTLRELRREVGNDAARFFYVLRKSEQHMDFDLDLAKSQSSENPVYYIQYAHARICSVFRKAENQGILLPESADYSQLTHEHEKTLLTSLVRYPEVVAKAAGQYEPHLIAYYLRELANQLHSYYNSCRFLDTPPVLRDARLRLLAAIRQTLVNGLQLLGVSAPESM